MKTAQTDRPGRSGGSHLAVGLAGILLIVALLGCSGEQAPVVANDGSAATAPVASPTPNVAGTFDFVGEEIPNTMSGTITFEQEGDVVRVTGTNYIDNPARELKGEATLEGTRLEMLLVPIDGTYYEAEVLFEFSEDGNSFEVSFVDTNNDRGDMGSYRGVRQSTGSTSP